MALVHEKCSESDTEDMLSREMTHCKRNVVDDMRQHLLEATIDHRLENEGSSYEMEHFFAEVQEISSALQINALEFGWSV